MTLAAAFQFREGYLVCVDSQHSSASKRYLPKIFETLYAHAPNRARSVIAVSGRVSYAEMAARRCAKEIARIPDNQLFVPTMEEAIHRALIDFHETDIFRHPLYQREGGPDFDLIVALEDGSSSECFYTNETAVNPISGYKAIGTGSYLSDYIADLLYSDDVYGLDLEDVLFLAVHILREVKKHDLSVGGWSDLRVIRRGKADSSSSVDVSQFDELSEYLQKSFNELFVVVRKDRTLINAKLAEIGKELGIITERHTYYNELLRKLRDTTPSISRTLEQA